MNAAITGATGFMGRHLVAELVAHGDIVTAVARGTSNCSQLGSTRIAVAELHEVERLSAAFRGCDVVYHLAGAVEFSDNWERTRQVNVAGTSNVLAAAKAAGVRRVVHCSSVAAVGASRHPACLDETARWNLGSRQIPYVTTKREAEVLALAANSAQLEVVVANPGCVVGPGDHAGSEFGSICQRFWRGRIPIHFGGGNNFVDVRDVARGLRLSGERGRPGERYILGGVNRTMTAFFMELAKASGQVVPRFRLPNAIGAFLAFTERSRSLKKGRRAKITPAQAALLDYYFYFDSGKARRELGYAARPLSESLADAFADWNNQRRAA